MSSKKKLNVFIISSWYPSKYDPFFGLFVKQTASYLSEHTNITVLNVNNRTDCTKTKFIVNQTTKNLLEISAETPKCKIGLLNAVKTMYLIHKVYNKAIKINGKPDILHLQILSVLIWFVYFKKIIHKIPFIVSEHWSKYFEDERSFSEKMKNKIQNKLLKKAYSTTVVSNHLKQSMITKGFNTPIIVIPNPIDSNLFTIQESTSSRTFVHISCFDEKIKNIKGIVKAFQKIQIEVNDINLILIGDGPNIDEIKDFVNANCIENIVFTGAIESKQVCTILNQSCGLIMNSYKETFGIPIVEAWMCGRPVISTPVGLAHDKHPKTNLIKTSINDVNSIIVAMKKIMEMPLDVKKNEEIRKYALEKFDKEIVVKQYLEIYYKAIKIE